MPFPLLIPAALAVAKSPVGKAIGGIVGGLFKKKNKGASKPVQAQSPILATTFTNPNQGMSLDAKGKKVVEQVNDILGAATKDVRTVTTAFDNKQLLMVGGGLAALLLLFVSLNRR